VARADAPGRVNLIGEHTDYNQGFVLPVVIPLATVVDLEPRGDRVVRAESHGFASITYSIGDEKREGGWGDYVRGVTWALAKAAQTLGGFQASIRSDIPPGAGLASSAALEVALLRAIRDAFGLSLDDLSLALVAHRGENDFVGARVGTMDQLAASLGRQGEALFIDTRTNEVQPIPFPSSMALIVIDSGIAHQHATGGYNARRTECEDAARLIGVPALRDATDADVARLERTRPDLAARARHVVTENARVNAFVTALRARDIAACGLLLDASHRSLRDDFAVSLPAIDALVELLRGQPGVFGARLVGGGFGGSVLAIAAPEAAAHAARAAADAYRGRTGGEPRLLLP
jgi:galactokinase